MEVSRKKISKGLAGYSWKELAGHMNDPNFAAAVEGARAKLAKLEQIIDSASK